MTGPDDPMDPMSARGRRALEHFRAAESLDDAVLARISRRLEARLAVGGSEYPTSLRAPRRIAPPLVGGAAGKAVLGFVLAAAAAWGTYETVHERSRTRSSAPTPPAAVEHGTLNSARAEQPPVASVRLDELPLATPVARGSAPNTVTAHSVAPDPTPTHSVPKLLQPNNAPSEQAPSNASSASRSVGSDAPVRKSALADDDSSNAPSADDVAEEVALLKSAQAAINAGRPTDALAALADHARRFPHGKLNESCEVARVIALCDSGQKTAARSAADRFLAARPNSPFASRVRAACAAGTASP